MSEGQDAGAGSDGDPRTSVAGPGSGGRRRSGLRVAAAVLLAAVLACAGVVLLARTFGWQGGSLLFGVAFTPYVGLGCLLVGIVAAVLRAWPVAVAGAVLFGVVAWWWAPAFVAAPTSAPPLDLQVMTANLRLGGADPASVVAAVRREGVDLLALEELTPEALRALTAAGLDDALPHRFVRAGVGATGTGIWSAHPLRQPFQTDGLGFENVGATVARPGGEMLFLGAHPVAPKPLDGSARDATLFPLLDLIKGLPGPVIVAGDFNATGDNVALRELTSAGYANASDAAGSGLVRTWPNDLKPLPPLVAIDHVLFREVRPAISLVTFEVPGSDHYAVVAGF